MKLSDLLDELRTNILRDVSDRAAGTPDWLYSDAQLIRYINLAQRRFARRSLILRDGTTPEITQVELQTGVDTYTLHPTVVAVISGRLEGDPQDLRRGGHSLFDQYQPPDRLWFDINDLVLYPDGKPVAFSTDEEIAPDGDDHRSAVVMRVMPKPSAAYNGKIINIRVCRLPQEDFRSENRSAECELPEDYQLEMLDWAAYRALLVVDRDAGDLTRAKDFAARFENSVMEARTDVMRKLFPPQGINFCRNGWQWEK